MAVERSEEEDVDSLFEDMVPEGALPSTKVHSAVTMRPEQGRPGPTASLLRVMTPPVITAAPARAAPSDPASLADAIAIVREARGALGHAVRDVDGVLTSHGAVDAGFADRVAYVARLAALLGDELGLESLRELRVLGATQSFASVLAHDGATLAVLASADAALGDLTSRKRR